jgi:hypothetical protein
MAKPNEMKSVPNTNATEEKKTGGRKVGQKLEGFYVVLGPKAKAALAAKLDEIEKQVGFRPEERTLAAQLLSRALGVTGKDE